jgi:formylglycine-generating enzyme required for sulfatase activity
VPELITITGGTFQMGSPVTEKGSAAYRTQELPQCEVTVRPFAIGRFLVTAEEFCVFLNEAGNDGYFIEDFSVYDWRTIYRPSGRYVPKPAQERCPACLVTWKGADAYCRWLSGKVGRRYRLPTEAEWEFAARGVELREWPWGSEAPLESRWWPKDAAQAMGVNADLLDKWADPKPAYVLHGERWDRAGWDEDERLWFMWPVGSFPLNATPEGVYDMLGYEDGQWCSDVYRGDASKRARTSASPKADGRCLRVQRGMPSVPVDRISYRPTLIDLIDREGAAGNSTEGRSWSRQGADEELEGGIFRVASDGE